MSRLIIFVVSVVLIYWLLKKYSGRGSRHDGEQVAKPEDSQAMVSCVHCGVNFPKDDGVTANGKHYCCDAHYRAHLNQ